MNWQNNADLEAGPRGGIVVNEKLQTNDHYIYAIGECALYNGMIYGLVAPGYEMADVVVKTNLRNPASELNGRGRFTGFDMSTKLKLIGVDVASFGDPFISGNDIRTIVIEDTKKEFINESIYRRW